MNLAKNTVDWILSAAARNGGARRGDYSVIRIGPLIGGSVSCICAVEIAGPDGERLDFVLRQYADESHLADEPDAAEHEATALIAMSDTPVPAPRLVAFDPGAAYCDVPSVLMTRLSGDPDLRPLDLSVWLRELAQALASIHRTQHASLKRPFKLWVDVEHLEIPSWAEDSGVWRALHQRILAGAPPAAEGFLHRDYHPGNILWHDRRISGIVDWVNSCAGPFEADVSHCRKNLAILHGIESAEMFDSHYRELTGTSRADPYWDACELSDNSPDFEGFLAFRSFHVPITAQQIASRINAFATHVATRLR
jgi:aminoglycoside phosphotransferase (APT) family kinase protein